MEFKKYICDNKESTILSNLIYSLSDNYPKGAYTSYTPTMFNIYEKVLLDKVGLRYLGFSSRTVDYQTKHEFCIENEKTFLIIKLTYGI